MADNIDAKEQNTNASQTRIAGDRRKNTGMMDKLNEGIGKNTLGQFSLVGELIKAAQVTTDLNKTFISVGQSQMISAAKSAGTFNMAGLSIAESMAIFKEMAQKGISFQDEVSKKTLRMTTNLGLNMHQMGTMLAFNTQTLGLNTGQANDLARATMETGMQYGISTDVLVGAINSLAQTLINTANAYGKGTATAVQSALTQMIGQYGASNEKLITQAFSQIYGGTAQASKTASILGADLSNLSSSDPEIIKSTMEGVLNTLQSIVAPAQNQGGSGFIVPALLEGLNASPALLKLAELVPLSAEEFGKSAEQAEREVLSQSVMTTIAETMTTLTVALLPLVKFIGVAVEIVAGLLTSFNGFFVKLALSILVFFKFAKMMSMITMTRRMKVGIAIMLRLNRNGFWLKRIWRQSISGNFGVIGGIIAMGAAITATAGIFGAFSEGQDDVKEELSKQTELLRERKSDNSLLAQIAQSMNRANIHSELLSRLSQDQLDALNDPTPAPVVINNLTPANPYVLP